MSTKRNYYHYIYLLVEWYNTDADGWRIDQIHTNEIVTDIEMREIDFHVDYDDAITSRKHYLTQTYAPVIIYDNCKWIIGSYNGAAEDKRRYKDAIFDHLPVGYVLKKVTLLRGTLTDLQHEAYANFSMNNKLFLISDLL